MCTCREPNKKNLYVTINRLFIERNTVSIHMKNCLATNTITKPFVITVFPHYFIK